jgi:predicted transglutaminase-like cysteine proteinase
MNRLFKRFASLLDKPAIVACLICLIPVSAFAQKGIFDFDAALLERVEKKYDKAAVKRLQDLTALVKEKANGSELDKVKYANDFFNKIPYYTDIVHWKKKDYWATPFEKITTDGGDCEDYAIGKYFALRELGVDQKKLRIMYVKAIEWNEAHMVLAYFPEENEIPLVLDNINKKLLRANKRKDLVPVYSFNVEGLWIAKARGTGNKVGSSDRIKLWTDLQKRMKDL